ncbi:hypothetical protein [Rhodococcus opacus]|nr:hypothetical protein [Rhodococcus opacus]
MADRVPQVGVCENGYRHEPLAGGRPMHWKEPFAGSVRRSAAGAPTGLDA